MLLPPHFITCTNFVTFSDFRRCSILKEIALEKQTVHVTGQNQKFREDYSYYHIMIYRPDWVRAGVVPSNLTVHVLYEFILNHKEDNELSLHPYRFVKSDAFIWRLDGDIDLIRSDDLFKYVRRYCTQTKFRLNLDK